ncbi:hypothetical protein IAT38_002106 [Cryptococcus sp. DSM 104549]
MTGGAFFPTAADEEYDLDHPGVESHAVQWIGTASVKGPKWARLPLLTVGMLGIQCVWSIEMGYASPYLLELGLSKSFMSLVFVAGPLSGLIVQPLVGIFADRSRSPLGRRRPFMLAGCAICVSAMMLLGWTREVAGLVGAGNGLAIALAVWAIYCIDFSINAVMSTDRALVVDTLPPREQEEGSAWAGRMFGFGSVAGFFVGNLDLPPVLPFLGKTQLQILSFITSAILMVSHTFTSWAVSERVLLRDDRPQSKSSLKANIKAIWDNMFSLPPGIRTVCIVQFFASLGWFPILFFTTVWVSEIYKASVPSDGIDPAVFSAQAVRSGARALLLQALVNIVTSIGMPFLVSESGVQPDAEYGYAALEGGEDAAGGAGVGSGGALGGGGAGGRRNDSRPLWKRASDELQRGGLLQRAGAWLGATLESVRKGEWGLPIKGLTLVRLWWFSQFVFAGAMAASWFVTTVNGAYMVIATTGFCWALSQWAPYSLLGELILIDGSIDRTQPISLTRIRTHPASARHSLTLSDPDVDPDVSGSTSHLPNPSSVPPPKAASSKTSAAVSASASATASASASARGTPLHSRVASHSSLAGGWDPNPSLSRDRLSRSPSFDDKPPTFSRTHRPADSLPGGLSPLIIQGETSAEPELGSNLVLRHSDELSASSFADGGDPSGPPRRQSSGSAFSPRASGDNAGEGGGAKGTADKAGVILGIHNVFLVLPQFIVTLMSSIIFYLMEPEKGLPAHHPGTIPVPGNATLTDAASAVTEAAAEATGEVVRRAVHAWMWSKREGVDVDVSSPDAVGLIFRIGGISAAIGGWICWRLGRDWARGKGI